MPSEETKEKLVFIIAKIENEDEEGKYDVDDWVLDYFIEMDEVGEIIGSAPFNYIQELGKPEPK